MCIPGSSHRGCELVGLGHPSLSVLSLNIFATASEISFSSSGPSGFRQFQQTAPDGILRLENEALENSWVGFINRRFIKNLAVGHGDFRIQNSGPLDVDGADAEVCESKPGKKPNPNPLYNRFQLLILSSINEPSNVSTNKLL